MPEQREVRVLVIGSSTAFMTTPQRTSRHDGPYPEHIDSELSALGITSRTFMRTQWHGMIHEARRRHESYRDVLPDVIVLNYGMAECQSRVMPTWLYRHFMSWDLGSRRVQVTYRKKIAPILWKPVRGWQRVGTKLAGQRTHRLSPQRYSRELTRMIKDLRVDLAPLILVLDIDPVTDRVEHWVPGIGKRVEHYNRVMRTVVDEFASTDVRYVETSAIVKELGFEAALPDGFHRSSTGHRHVAAMLAQEIAPWAKEELA